MQVPGPRSPAGSTDGPLVSFVCPPSPILSFCIISKTRTRTQKSKASITQIYTRHVISLAAVSLLCMASNARGPSLATAPPMQTNRANPTTHPLRQDTQTLSFACVSSYSMFRLTLWVTAESINSRLERRRFRAVVAQRCERQPLRRRSLCLSLPICSARRQCRNARQVADSTPSHQPCKAKLLQPLP